MYRGVQLCHGAAEFVRFARARNIRTFFLSNNSRSGPEVVARKLTGLDVATPAEEVITAAELAVEHLAALGHARIFHVDGGLLSLIHI